MRAEMAPYPPKMAWSSLAFLSTRGMRCDRTCAGTFCTATLCAVNDDCHVAAFALSMPGRQFVSAIRKDCSGLYFMVHAGVLGVLGGGGGGL